MPAKKILLLSANPLKTGRLRLDEEVREIKEGIKRSQYRDDFTVEAVGAVRYRDLGRQMLDINPNIVHFSGHGQGNNSLEDKEGNSRKFLPLDEVGNAGLILEDESGNIKLVGAEALGKLFALFKDNLECVVLNACYSQVQAEAIALHIPWVVGMGKAIGDRAAIEFAIAFYDALGSGKGYEFAFNYACAAVDIAGIPESSTPKLLQGKAQTRTDSTTITPKITPASQAWRKKLAFLQEQEAFAADPAQKFQLGELIAEAKRKIAELES